MMILSISTIIYGGYNFINHFIQGSDINIYGIFNRGEVDLVLLESDFRMIVTVPLEQVRPSEEKN
jgi:hypothetical protein